MANPDPINRPMELDSIRWHVQTGNGARDVLLLLAEVERLTAENEQAKRVRQNMSRCIDDLQARIDAALVVCAEMPAIFWDIYPGGSLARVRAALGGAE